MPIGAAEGRQHSRTSAALALPRSWVRSPFGPPESGLDSQCFEMASEVRHTEARRFRTRSLLSQFLQRAECSAATTQVGALLRTRRLCSALLPNQGVP